MHFSQSPCLKNMAISIPGNWYKGFALDYHTTDSVYLGDDSYGNPRFDTNRSEIGELLYQLKYKNDLSVLAKIIQYITNTIKGIEKFDFIIPVPPSKQDRSYQPVYIICKGLEKVYEIPFLNDAFFRKQVTQEIKYVADYSERIKLLKDSISFNGKYNLKNKNILLIDDLYRSGATLTVITDVLYNTAKVKKVSVLTLTKTRSNR